MADLPKAGSYVGWREGSKRRYGLMLSVDRDTGDWWVLRLHHPWRRCRRLPGETTLLAGPSDTAEALDRLAIAFRKSGLMDASLTPIAHGVELDVVTRSGSWSLRFAEQTGGALSLIVIDHSSGAPVVAELLHQQSAG